MKRTILMILAIVLLLALTPMSAVRADGAVTVHSIDELIAAIAPGAEIHIAEGEYLLSESATYGQRSGNPYVKWKELYGTGYMLSIHDLDDLCIIGSGADTTRLISDCQDADVLEIEDCTGITLRGFTGGHTPQAEGCSAGVIRLYRGENITLTELGLFGCGAVGVEADQIRNLSITDSEIYDCSHSGINLTGCEAVHVNNCSLHGIGKWMDGWNAGYSIFNLFRSRGVDITACEITGCDVQLFLTTWDSRDICLKDSRIADNAFTSAVMELADSEVVVETNNVFEDDTFSHWYYHGWDGTSSSAAVDENGDPAFAEDPQPLHTTSDPVVTVPVITGEQKQVRVSTVDELLAAIDSDTEIILANGCYDLSAATDYGTGSGEHYTWEDTYDGPQLVVFGVQNFSIVSEDDVPSLCIVSAVPRYAQVISFRDCSNVMLRGFTAGHTVEPSMCAGGVLFFEKSSNILTENCNLYGCGILGVIAITVDNLQIANSQIYECSYGGIQCSGCSTVSIGGCQFWDLGGPTFQLDSCTDVNVDGRTVKGSYYGD